jgi:hypothetical protein
MNYRTAIITEDKPPHSMKVAESAVFQGLETIRTLNVARMCAWNVLKDNIETWLKEENEFPGLSYLVECYPDYITVHISKKFGGSGPQANREVKFYYHTDTRDILKMVHEECRDIMDFNTGGVENAK